jgi:hypothetical protein
MRVDNAKKASVSFENEIASFANADVGDVQHLTATLMIVKAI